MINPLHRRGDEQESQTGRTALHKGQTISVANSTFLGVQQVLGMASCATKTPEFPERIVPEIVFIMRYP
jgi:hypothetical protein